ncbi:metallophosphoesterase 1 isoform X3 [Poecile atricapillus]|uniref:metallophosphoesterase 1 isoform X3 n=1 Tax=Poecile atricapillus TaxID=48891 RepID=UPI00273A3ACB|nr:metallophosphoesterase 1 isoform X3 [Poecile atricapillus]
MEGTQQDHQSHSWPCAGHPENDTHHLNLPRPLMTIEKGVFSPAAEAEARAGRPGGGRSGAPGPQAGRHGLRSAPRSLGCGVTARGLSRGPAGPVPEAYPGLSRPIPACPGLSRLVPPRSPALAMARPVVHRCLQLTDENEQLVKKVKKLHIKNKELEKNLGQIQEQLHLQQLMHVCGTSRDVQVQTETHLWHKGGDSKDLVLESDSVRLLQMFNELQKRYVKETKINKEQSEAIKNLTIKINELERNLQEQKQKIEKLERKKVSWKTSAVSGKQSQTPEGGVASHRDISAKESCCSRYLELLLKEIKKLKKENGKLSAERRALKNELAGLDKDFFEEVEDLKHAVQESVKLNNEYEKCLKQISVIYGLPFTAHL